MTSVYKYHANNTLGSGAYSIVKKSHQKETVLLITRSQMKIDYYRAIGLLKGEQNSCLLTYNRHGYYDGQNIVSRLVVPIVRLYEPTRDEYLQLETEYRKLYYDNDIENVAELTEEIIKQAPILSPALRFLVANQEQLNTHRINWDVKRANVMVTKQRVIVPLDVINFDAMFGYPDSISDSHYNDNEST